MATSIKRPATRAQHMVVIYGIVCFALILVVLQLWLFTATMNAWLGNDTTLVWPAFGASMACLLLNVGLLRYL
jgi:type IV secretory pathway TrbD component